MKTTLSWLLIALTSFAFASTTQLPLISSQCYSFGGFCGTWPCLIATWGPGQGSQCTVGKTLNGNSVQWGCIGSDVLAYSYKTPTCNCENDYSANLALSVDAYPACTLDPANQVVWPYSHFCDSGGP